MATSPTSSTRSSPSGRSVPRSTRSTSADLTPLNRGLAEPRETSSAADYGARRRRAAAAARRIVSFWETVDVVAHADARAAARADRLAGRRRGRDRAAPPQHRVHAVHRGREPHRPAGDVAPAPLDARTASRSASRRSARPQVRRFSSASQPSSKPRGRGPTGGRPLRTVSARCVIRMLLTGRGVQHPRGAPARDRERHVLVAVLVEDDVARTGVRERSRHRPRSTAHRRARARRAFPTTIPSASTSSRSRFSAMLPKLST